MSAVKCLNFTKSIYMYMYNVYMYIYVGAPNLLPQMDVGCTTYHISFK